MNAQAAQAYQEARSRELDNRVKNASTYFEARSINRAARAAEDGPPLTSDQLFRIAHRGIPRALTTDELDPITGAINWPLLLRDEQFTGYRVNVEQLFADRAREGRDFSYQTVMELQKAVDAWTTALTARIKEYRSQDFIDAKRFLESVAYQSRKT
jgi:hypothetical protein